MPTKNLFWSFVLGLGKVRRSSIGYQLLSFAYYSAFILSYDQPPSRWRGNTWHAISPRCVAKYLFWDFREKESDGWLKMCHANCVHVSTSGEFPPEVRTNIGASQAGHETCTWYQGKYLRVSAKICATGLNDQSDLNVPFAIILSERPRGAAFHPVCPLLYVPCLCTAYCFFFFCFPWLQPTNRPTCGFW